jgi:hypothetical protein
MLAGELHPHPPPDLVEVAALHVRVRPGEVDELEDAQRRVGRRVADRAGLAARLEDHHLARFDVADVLGADDVEGGRLGRQEPGVAVAPGPRSGALGTRCDALDPSEHERPEAVRVADADEPVLVEDHERERAPDPGQQMEERVHRVGRGLVREERREELRVGRRGEASASALELVEELAGVDEVAVVADRH